MEEEEGADEGTQGPGDKAGTEPPQDAAQLQHGIAAGHHHQGRVPSRQLEVLHGRRWSSLTRSAPLSEVHEGSRRLPSNPPAVTSACCWYLVGASALPSDLPLSS